MNITKSNKVLIFHFALYIVSGGLIWTINLLGQLRFSGYNFLSFFNRSVILIGLVTISYYLNNKFSKKTSLENDILKFKLKYLKHYLNGCVLGFLLIAVMWGILYLIYPFEIVRNHNPKVILGIDIISYSLGNTLEELLFRGFLFLSAVRLFGKTGAIFLISLLFGLFHLPGLGLTMQGLSMVITTFTMSLLFIAVIYYTESIWTAVVLHITINILLHTVGFDGAGNGLFNIEFAASDINGLFFTLVCETVVIASAIVLFIRGKKAIDIKEVQI
ncbi:membrane protease YdiL (CAAX protease family) [Chryseobacterium sp. SORGH_AS 447]|uniref:CPBP family intramembrane glutamic endopeptidase n=1 Tax=Chryseobacterium sp. SORGH_AS_0447 TaxID=3041769 RepID=UPI0027848843|nr:type II CAAX endopeptidase family protein [Chryseobacterium sp. SORGH_AS_0447]MDQ1162449.1 membrane protease YdiL (CAAX protease family) [Chryseobacterium sp. SORGH_AS_0447]